MTADKRVVPGPAIQRVVIIAAVEQVVPAETVEEIIRSEAIQNVIQVRSANNIGCIGAIARDAGELEALHQDFAVRLPCVVAVTASLFSLPDNDEAAIGQLDEIRILVLSACGLIDLERIAHFRSIGVEGLTVQGARVVNFSGPRNVPILQPIIIFVSFGDHLAFRPDYDEATCRQRKRPFETGHLRKREDEIEFAPGSIARVVEHLRFHAFGAVGIHASKDADEPA